MVVFVLILILIAVVALALFVWNTLREPDKPKLEARKENYFVPLNGKPTQKGVLPPQPARMFRVAAEFNPQGTVVNLNAPCWITGQIKSKCGCKECSKTRKAGS